MECAVFAIVGVVVGAVLMLAAKADVRGVRLWDRRKNKEADAEAALPGKAKSEEELMRQWESLLCYSGGSDDEARI